MAQAVVVQLVRDADGKWTANVRGVPAPGMADALRVLADRIERGAALSRGQDALRQIHAAQAGQPLLSEADIEAEIRGSRSERRTRSR